MVPKCGPILTVALRLLDQACLTKRKNGEKLRSFVKRKTQPKHPPPPPPRTDSFTPLLSALCGIIVLMHLIASFFPKGRIWGFNQWAYFSPAVSLSLGVLALLLFVPRVNQRFRQGLDVAASSVLNLFDGAKKIFHRRVWYAVCSLLFFIPFWLLRDRTHLLGDGAQIISRMNSGELYIKWSEPLEILLHVKAYQLVNKLWQMDSATVYVLLSCFAGVVFLLLLFFFADFLGRDRKEKVLVFLILLTTGSTQLFFGYAEHYSFTYVFVFAFISSSLAYLEGKARWFLPVGAFLLASSSHVTAAYLLPALLFLFLAKGKDGRKPSLAKRTSVLVLGTAVLASVLILYLRHGWTVPPVFVPLTQDIYAAPGYLLFSLPHILDLLNHHLLVSPVGPALILAALACLSVARLLKDRIFRFLLVVGLSQLVFNFLVDPALGAPRDWDLFSTVALGYTVLGLFVFLRLLRGKASFGYLAVILVAASLYSTVPWIATQSSEWRAIRRFENLLQIDEKRSANGHFILIKHFESRGRNSLVERQTEKYRDAFPELALIANGSKAAKAGELDRAEEMFLQAERLAPKLGQVHNNLGRIYLDRGDLSRAEAELKQSIRLSSHLHAPYVNLSDVYLLRQDYSRALDACRRAIRLKTDSPQAYSNAATIYLMRNDLKRAENHYKEALNLEADFVEAYVGLGDIYNRKAMPQEAVRMYQAALTVDPHLAIARYRLGITYLALNATQEAEEQLQMYLNISPGGKEAERVQEILEKLRLPKP